MLGMETLAFSIHGLTRDQWTELCREAGLSAEDWGDGWLRLAQEQQVRGALGREEAVMLLSAFAEKSLIEEELEKTLDGTEPIPYTIPVTTSRKGGLL